MNTSAAGRAFLEKNEGLRLTVYNDAGHPAIGYGHDLLPGETFPGGITPAQADALLSTDLATRFEPAVTAAVASAVPPSCTQNQFDALVDFCYNEGPRNLAIMLSHGWAQIPSQMPRWCYEEVEGVTVKSAGLAARRAAEVKMFTGVNAAPAA